jgi:hypothetical protein
MPINDSLAAAAAAPSLAPPPFHLFTSHDWCVSISACHGKASLQAELSADHPAGRAWAVTATELFHWPSILNKSVVAPPWNGIIRRIIGRRLHGVTLGALSIIGRRLHWHGRIDSARDIESKCVITNLAGYRPATGPGSRGLNKSSSESSFKEPIIPETRIPVLKYPSLQVR